MRNSLLDVIVCPACNGKLKMTQDGLSLFCSFDKLLFEIKDDVPNMLINEASQLNEEDIEGLKLR
ncbi:Trm112 family protein [Pleionea litopenaei]|uniref:Uncharacterized protein n=1 Tax=Pleionea litopenaei TaxID=3070815 RepID=A0AA51X780_9GAMM|nr:Trm112 family protein [Pleionea sp. HL-JVS1]WMS88042.1 hypothetical protein Q9312_03785 [Pleionea sp. HL-JVS1]